MSKGAWSVVRRHTDAWAATFLTCHLRSMCWGGSLGCIRVACSGSKLAGLKEVMRGSSRGSI